MDYEHIPFRCKRCHEYGYLFKQCPLIAGEEAAGKVEAEKRRTEETEGEKEGFQEVQKKRRYGKEPVSKPQNPKPA